MTGHNIQNRIYVGTTTFVIKTYIPIKVTYVFIL
jgi:hypothetical protein